jgi:hypothetical protein
MAFVKIDKRILDSYCFSNPSHLKIWIWLLVKANYKKSYVPVNIGRGISTIEVDRGQLIFGRFKAEEELLLDGSLIYRTLKKFEELEQIIIESNNQYSIITICNYDSYQNKNEKNEQQTNSKRTTNEQQTNNERTMNEQSLNNERTTNEQSLNTSKEVLEDKEYIELKEVKEELEFLENINYSDKIGKNENFEKNEILNPESFPTWRDECAKFLKDEYFKKTFIKNQGVELPVLEELMKEFVIKLNLENDFKNTAALKKHFTNHYMKHKNGKATYTAFSNANSIIDVDEDMDYDNMQTW